MDVAFGGMATTIIPPQSSASRNLSTGLPQGMRRIPPAFAMLPPPPPIPEQFNTAANGSSNSMLSASGPLSTNQVISLARQAMDSALRENETQAAGASGVSTELKPGVTIDLSRKNIQALPDEVVDIIKNELERLVFSLSDLCPMKY